MWDYDHNMLPLPQIQCFTSIHNYKTRSALRGNLYHAKVNTFKYGLKSFKYQGVQVLNSLKKLDIYRDAKSKENLLKYLKLQLLSKYT